VSGGARPPVPPPPSATGWGLAAVADLLLD